MQLVKLALFSVKMAVSQHFKQGNGTMFWCHLDSQDLVIYLANMKWDTQAYVMEAHPIGNSFFWWKIFFLRLQYNGDHKFIWPVSPHLLGIKSTYWQDCILCFVVDLEPKIFPQVASHAKKCNFGCTWTLQIFSRGKAIDGLDSNKICIVLTEKSPILVSAHWGLSSTFVCNSLELTILKVFLLHPPPNHWNSNQIGS